jgi:hypothetical protein
LTVRKLKIFLKKLEEVEEPPDDKLETNKSKNLEPHAE